MVAQSPSRPALSITIPGGRVWLEGALVFLGCAFALALIQFSGPYLAGIDGYYHIKVAYLMRTEGLVLDFHWLPFTIWNAQEFVDHEFLFHLLQMPFTFGDLMLGGKIATVLLGVTPFLAIWVLLRGQRVLRPWFWTFALLAISQAFLYRMSLPRAQALSLAVMVLAMHWLLQEKHWRVFALAWVHVWLFSGFPLFLAVAGAYSAAVWLMEERLVWKPLAYAGGGVAAGLLIHPYFPRTLVFTYRHLLPKIFEVTTASVGGEWSPYTTGDLLANSGRTFALLILALLALVFTRKNRGLPVIFSLLTVFGFGYLLMQSRRMIEYFPAIVLIFSALSISAWLREREEDGRPWGLAWIKKNISPAAAEWLGRVALVAMVFLAWQTVEDTNLSGETSGIRYRGGATWLVQNTEEGAPVFNLDWDDFPELFFHNSHNTYMLGLDPTFMELYDPALFETYVAITLGQVDMPAALIQEQFGASYVFSDQFHGAFESRALEDPRISKVYEDENTIVYQVSDAPE